MRRAVLLAAACLALAPAQAAGQAAELAEHVRALAAPVRVLLIGAHPDDEDTALLAWLSRGRGVETAYLSLTRGDGGQNLIGHELGEALGVIRTEELLAARRIDGGRQYFTRAYDFGYSKSAGETLQHWPRDSILRDVLTVVRAFRPHVLVSIFSGTPRDGHGQHQVAGLMALEAFEAAADGARFPPASTAGHRPWTPLKLYRSTFFQRDSATLRINVGEFSPLRGRSYAELAAASRSEHRSQGFGMVQRKGVQWTWIRRERSRVAAPDDPLAERSLFDGIDTTWRRLRAVARDAASRAAIDSLAIVTPALDSTLDLRRPDTVIPRLARVKRLLHRAWCGGADSCVTDTVDPITSSGRALDPDLERSLLVARRHADQALLLASGAVVEATVSRPMLAVGDTATVEIAIYNRGDARVAHGSMYQIADEVRRAALTFESLVPIARDSVRRYSMQLDALTITQPWWLRRSRRGDLFAHPASDAPEAMDASAARIAVTLAIGDARVWAEAPVVWRVGDPVRGDLRQPLAVAPPISVTLDEYDVLAPAGAPIDRIVRVHLTSSATDDRDVRVAVEPPSGLRADSAARRLTLPAGASRTVEFRLRGRLAAGEHRIAVAAESGGERFARGWRRIDHPHIAPQTIYRPSVLTVQAIDVRVPDRLTVAYVPGVSDNVAPRLQQLGIDVTVIEPDRLASAELSRFTTLVIGPRAYEAHPALAANRGRLLDFARRGGTLVVQYGQYEMMETGVLPYPIRINRPHRRVSLEEAPVTLVRPEHPLLQRPNRITRRDFEGWVQERALYMPSSYGEEYTTVLAMADPGETPLESAILYTPWGDGAVVYTSLAFFRQLPAGVPGATRLFVNLLAADGAASASTGR